MPIGRRASVTTSLRFVIPLSSPLAEHDLIRKPVDTPDQVGAGLFGIMRQTHVPGGLRTIRASFVHIRRICVDGPLHGVVPPIFCGGGDRASAAVAPHGPSAFAWGRSSDFYARPRLTPGEPATRANAPAATLR
jgi:hypothetical protein